MPPLYSPVAIWPGKNALVSGWNFLRFASQPGRANVDGQITSEVITSGVGDPDVKRCVSCSYATSEVGESVRMLTWIFGCSFSNAFTAAMVAVPSAPRPWVANTMVCFALAGTCLPAEPPLLLQPTAASDAAVPIATATTDARRLRVKPIRVGPVRPADPALAGHLLIVATSSYLVRGLGASPVRGRLLVLIYAVQGSREPHSGAVEVALREAPFGSVTFRRAPTSGAQADSTIPS